MTAEIRGEARALEIRLHDRLAAVRAPADDPAFVEAVLRLRARRLASARAVVEEAPAGSAMLCFGVAAERYGLPLDELSEVMPLAAWTPVPGLSQQLLGVMNVRGEIRPVLDLHSILGLPAPEAAEGGYVVFLRSPVREVGLRVDALERIRFVESQGLTLPHEAANGLPQRFVAGITPDTLVLLDSRQILALDVLQDRQADYRRAV